MRLAHATLASLARVVAGVLPVPDHVLILADKWLAWAHQKVDPTTLIADQERVA